MGPHAPFSIKLSAPGKVILFGEYSVVFKKPAVAATLCLRTSLHLEETNSGNIDVSFSALGLEKRFSINDVRNCVNVPDTDSWEEYVTRLGKAVEHLYEKTYGVVDLTEAQKLSLTAFFHAFGRSPDSCEGIRLKIDSQLPVGSGVGSSASFSVVLSSAAVLYSRSGTGLDNYIERETGGKFLISEQCKEKISDLTFSCEKIFHGSPSGVDHNTILQGSIIEFVKVNDNDKKLTPVTSNSIRILLVNTNVTRSTKKLVERFKELKTSHPEVIDCVLDAMGNVAKSAVNDLKALKESDNDSGVEAHFGDLINLNHGLLRLLGASHPSLEAIVSTAEKYNLKAKLTGAGGGGFGFIYVPVNTGTGAVNDVSKELRGAGFTVYDVTLGGPGLMYCVECAEAFLISRTFLYARANEVANPDAISRTAFWETICQEHGIDESGAYVGNDELQKKNIDVYFREIKDFTYTPKSVMIDLDRRAIHGVRNSPYGQIFNPDNAICGLEGAGNNWAKAHFTEGAEVSNNALEVIRKEAESCDCLTEIETIHSVGGGAGAGLGSLILSKLDEEFPNTILTTYSIIPSSNISNCVVEPYNAVLTLNYLIDYTNKSFCMDNDALYSIAENLNFTQADFGGVNSIMSCTMSGITTFTRFPGPSNLSFKKFIVNAVPFPRLHFFVSGLGSTIKKTKAKQEVTLADLVATAFDYNSYLAACDMKKGIFLTAACVFRGKLSAKEVLKHLDRAKNKNSPNFVEWIPNNLKVSFCDITPPNWTGPLTTFIANTTSVQDIFKRLHTKYRKMLKRKMFLHWFIGEGMDEVDFEEAEENLVTVIEEYKTYERNSNIPG